MADPTHHEAHPSFYDLMAYSEWLDGDQHILTSEGDDERSHQALIHEFLDEHLPHVANPAA